MLNGAIKYKISKKDILLLSLTHEKVGGAGKVDEMFQKRLSTNIRERKQFV